MKDHDTQLKLTMDRIENSSEAAIKFSLKAILLTDRISTDTVEKALDLASHVRPE